MARKQFVILALAILLGFTYVAAQVKAGGSIFLLITDSSGYYVGGTGWYAGYVVVGVGGTYDLEIFATGGENNGHWPIRDVHIVAAISDEAAGGGLTSLKIDGVSITGWTPGLCPNWPVGPEEGGVGGPFSEPDYYGYNDAYVVPGGLTTTSGTREDPKPLVVEVSFGASATSDSKVALLAYGIDAKDQWLKTPYSGGTTFIVPELGTLLLTLAPFAALTAYAFKRKKN